MIPIAWQNPYCLADQWVKVMGIFDFVDLGAISALQTHLVKIENFMLDMGSQKPFMRSGHERV